MFKLYRSGSWYFKSESDPSFQGQGTSNSVGMFSMPPECKKAIEDLESILERKAPEDLEYGAFKD